MNRTKILENFSSKFKTRKMRDEFNSHDKKMKKERLRQARRAAQDEEDMTWEQHRSRRDDE